MRSIEERITKAHAIRLYYQDKILLTKTYVLGFCPELNLNNVKNVRVRLRFVLQYPLRSCCNRCIISFASVHIDNTPFTKFIYNTIFSVIFFLFNFRRPSKANLSTPYNITKRLCPPKQWVEKLNLHLQLTAVETDYQSSRDVSHVICVQSKTISTHFSIYYVLARKGKINSKGWDVNLWTLSRPARQ